MMQMAASSQPARSHLPHLSVAAEMPIVRTSRVPRCLFHPHPLPLPCWEFQTRSCCISQERHQTRTWTASPMNTNAVAACCLHSTRHSNTLPWRWVKSNHFLVSGVKAKSLPFWRASDRASVHVVTVVVICQPTRCNSGYRAVLVPLSRIIIACLLSRTSYHVKTILLHAH